jgi:hypothetical protein
LAAAILLWAAVGLVPLGLRLCEDAQRSELAKQLMRIANWLKWPGAALLAGSFLFDQGGTAAALAMPWFGVTLLIALVGGIDLWRYGRRLDYQAGLIAAKLFLPVGGAWAVISRAGLRPQDFSQEIVLLTAVHFHYAGFVLPVIAGMTSRRGGDVGPRTPSPSSRWGLAFDRIMLAAIIAGVPLVGLGISLSPHIEVAAAMLLTAGCVLLAVRQLQVAAAAQNPTVLALLGISSLALLSAMGLAAVYAVGEFTGQQMLSIPTMIRTHGVANALGFATCGLVGWACKK